MKMREYLQEFYKLFSTDEILLRLLHYKPEDSMDDPLSPNKPNILDMPIQDRYEIIDTLMKFTPTTEDLTKKSSTCRLFFYPSRRGNTTNYAIADQNIKFDVFVHMDFNDKDMRLAWICDHINDLLFDKHITGMKKLSFVGGNEIGAPEGYTAFQLIYNVGSHKR
ncbi:hypothetical protein [Halobacillus litoralis]|uniref:hypothetical protein n=1 Tax=Halobacillus litoralis TaxID=45668 RepID=UPI001CD61FEC|nr:hypothetical protein [Halobacillus litoralis]MCA1021645.1 hypothetical protein [Halobacillus litoralis]